MTVTQCCFVWTSIVGFVSLQPRTLQYGKEIIEVHVFFLSFPHALSHTYSFKYPTIKMSKSRCITDVLHITVVFSVRDKNHIGLQVKGNICLSRNHPLLTSLYLCTHSSSHSLFLKQTLLPSQNIQIQYISFNKMYLFMF